MPALMIKLERLSAAPAKAAGHTTFQAVGIIGDKVINGTLMPSEVVQRDAPLWKDIPVTIGHSPDSIIHADEASEWAAKNKIGVISASRAEGGKLLFEIDLDNYAAAEIITKLSSTDRPMEVSTEAVWVVRFQTGISRDGEAFSRVADSTAMPILLALLPDKTGACSVDDGCGLHRRNALTKARKPEFDGFESTPWAAVDKSLGAFIVGFNRFSDEPNIALETTVENLPKSAKQWIANKTLLGDPEANNLRDLTLFPVVNPATNKINANGLRAVLSGRGAQASISVEALEGARELAQRLLENTEVELGRSAAREALARAAKSVDGEQLGYGEGIVHVGLDKQVLQFPYKLLSYECGNDFVELGAPTKYMLSEPSADCRRPIMAENKAENDDHQIAEDPPKANTGGTCGQPPIVRAESDDQPAAAKSYEDLVIRASEMEKRLAAIEAENNARRQAEVTRNEAEIAEISERLKQQGVAIEHMAGAPVAAWREMERFAKVNTTNKKVADYSASLGVASDLDDEIKFDPTTVYWASPSGGAN